MSTRHGGVSPAPYGMNTSFNVNDVAANVAENRKRFLHWLGIPEDRLAMPQQRHTSVIRRVTAGGTYEACDALITADPGIYLSVSVADCAPVFVYDESKHVVACIHAGWRGTAQRIVQNTLKTMQQEFGCDPSRTLAFIGPCASSCCYEVGEEVAAQFDPEFVERREGKIYLNIKKANQSQLLAQGIPASQIEVHPDCTICRKELYHSFRRDREQSGRMMGIIGMRS